MTNLLTRLLNQPTLARIRRNHALEHATIHLLSQRHPGTTLIGRSDAQGFFLYGAVSADDVADAARQALRRLRGGERSLAYHANCGTNLVTSAALAGSASFLALMGSRDEGWRERSERLPFAIVLALFALIAAQPLGRAAQIHLTTNSNMDGLRIIDVTTRHSPQGTVHRVLTTS